MEEMLKNIGKQIQNGMSVPIGYEDDNFLFLIKDNKDNLEKFINKVENFETISEIVYFINEKTNLTTLVNIIIIKMNTGNYYPLFVIGGVENMLSKYNKAKNIELIFFDGLNIYEKTALLEKKVLPETEEKEISEENYLGIYNFIKNVKPFELEGLVAQVQNKETRPEIYYS